MGFNSPLPQSLQGECDKAAHILREFTMPSATRGPDKLIPASLLRNCKGLAIITVAKAGFLVAVRAGSGVVIAKTSNGWSAPSAIGLGGIGGGFEIGGEITDFVFILNNKQAVTAFSKGGNVTLGGNMSVAAGPLGRSVEADVSARAPAAIFTYSKTRGLFAGMSLEGTILVERKGANRKLYGMDCRARDLLAGRYDPPKEAHNLYMALEEVSGVTALRNAAVSSASRYAGQASWGAFVPPEHRPKRPTKSSASTAASSAMSSIAGAFSSVGGAIRKTTSSSSSKDKGKGASDASEAPGHMSTSAAATERAMARVANEESHPHPTQRNHVPQSVRKQLAAKNPKTHRVEHTSASAYSPAALKAAQHEKLTAEPDWDADTLAKAEFDFEGEMDCDLSFKKGDTIIVLTRTDTQNDWWEGEIDGQVGIFPANRVKLL